MDRNSVDERPRPEHPAPEIPEYVDVESLSNPGHSWKVHVPSVSCPCPARVRYCRHVRIAKIRERKARANLARANAAYRAGLHDGRTANDTGVDVWGYGPYADEYGAGVRAGIEERKAA